jgi:RHS repeat-associated protein
MALWVGLLLALPMKGDAAQETCKFGVFLEVLAVSTNYPQKGFLPFMFTNTVPQIYLKKKIELTSDAERSGTGGSYPDPEYEEWDMLSIHYEYMDELEYPSGSTVLTVVTNSGKRIVNQSWDYQPNFTFSDSYTVTRTNGSSWSPPSGYIAQVVSESLLETNFSLTRSATMSTNGVITAYSPDPFPGHSTGETESLALAGYFFNECLLSSWGSVTAEQTYNYKVQLSTPINLTTFLSEAISKIQSEAYPTNKQAVFAAKASMLGVPQNTGGLEDGTFQPEVSKFKYRVVYRGPKDEKGTIVLRFTTNLMSGATSPGGTNVANNDIKIEVTFNGECQTLDWKEVLPPTANGAITLELVSPKGGCNTCAAPGVGGGHLGSLGYEVSMGRLNNGDGAGVLFIHEENAGAQLGTPAVLKKFLSPHVKVVEQGGAVRQVIAPECTVDVVTVSTNKFELRFYPPLGAGSSPGTNGLYAVSGTVFRTWVFEGTSGGGLEIRDGTGGGARSWAFEAITDGWRMTEPGGQTVNERINQTVSGNRVEKTSIKDGANNLIYYSEREWKTVGGIEDDLLIRETVGSGGDAQSTYYAYYESAGAGFGKLKLTLYPDGNWEKLTYNTNNLVTKRVTPFKSAATNAADNLCRVLEYSYTPITNLDNGMFMTNEARTITESVLGTAVSKTYVVYTGLETWSIRAWKPEAAWTDTANEKTVTRTRSSLAGLSDETVTARGLVTVQEIENATNGYRTNIVTEMRSGTSGSGNSQMQPRIWLGAPIENNSKNTSRGTMTVSVTTSNGWPVSSSTYEIFSTGNILVDQVTYSNVDAAYGPRTVTYFDGTSETTTYDCCGVTARTDRNGVETVYAYDSNHRLISTTRLGVTTTHTKDAAGNVLATTRTGTDDSEIVVSRAGYDTAGRQKFSVDGLGNTNRVAEALSSSELVRTSTYPNEETVIETYYRDGSLKSVTGTATHGESYDYGVESIDSVPHLFTKVTKLTAAGTTTGEWVKTYTDPMGRSVRTTYSDNTMEQSFYNSQGQLTKSIERTGRITLYQYNSTGDLEYTVVDMDRDGVIDWSGSDRITQSVSSVISAHGTAVRRSETYVWVTDGQNAPKLVGISDQSLDGLRSWQIIGTVTNSSEVTYPGGGVRRVTQTRSDGSQVVQETTSGRPTSVKVKDSTGAQLALKTFGYDAHGRRSTVTDARNGTTTMYYNAGDLVATNVTAVPGTGRAAQTTIMLYDNMGRVNRTILPDKTEVEQEYHKTGELKRSWGSRTYPVEYDYDHAGRVKWLKTFKEESATNTSALTQWFYTTNNGSLLKKRYDDGKEVTYGYGTNTLLNKRTWARGAVANYEYDHADGLKKVDYADLTMPDVEFEYDRLGRKKKVHQGPAGITRETVEFYYADFGGAAGQQYSSGLLKGIALTNRFDGHLRRVQVGMKVYGTNLYTAGYGYDAGSRLGWVTNGSSVVSYGYHANSPLTHELVFKHSGTTRLTLTKEYDALNRLTSIENEAGGGGIEAWGYEYNDANQRSVVRLADGSYWEYRYDRLGQVVSGKKYFRDGTPMAGQQFGYGFDDIGNREATERDGNTAAYVANGVNQYSQRTVPGVVPVVGKATPLATVEVNLVAASRKGDYFWRFLSVNNAYGAVSQDVSVRATPAGGGTYSPAVTGKAVLPPATEYFVHDADGNLTEDGLWTYTWDSENRLVAMQGRGWGNGEGTKQLVFSYDWMGRRIRKLVRQGQTVVEERRYVYDGWNLIAEFNGTTNLLKSYTWGKDLSGSLQGAGGVGGLLAMTTYTNSTTVTGIHYAGYDGNGNVNVLVNATNGVWSGQYEYGPFGEPIRVSGTAARDNPFRFSTKYEDTESGHLYYGYRYYNPSTGRWLSRDPIGEIGGYNVYGGCANDFINKIDRLGLVITPDETWTPCTLNINVRLRITFQGKPFDPILDEQNRKLREELLGKGAITQDQFLIMEQTMAKINTWSEEEKSRYKKDIIGWAQGYFNHWNEKKYKCVCPGATHCKDGVKINVNIIMGDGLKAIPLHVYKNSRLPESGAEGEFDGRSIKVVNEYRNGRLLVHEILHFLGADHPGQRLSSRAIPNSEADYDADVESIMGRGLKFRPLDYEQVICDRLQKYMGGDWKPEEVK